MSNLPYDPDEFYAPVPAAGVFDSPGVSLCLNTEWASHLDGLIGQLLRRSYWAGADSDVDAAIQEVQKLLDKLADVDDCQTEETMTLPVGSIMAFAGAAAPADWLLCDGAAISRETYAALFQVLGTTYGAGNNTTTFNLPDLRGRAGIGAGQGTGLSNRALGAKIGAETHTLTVAEMPTHNHDMHYLWGYRAGDGNMTYALSRIPPGQAQNNAGGGQAHNNMPPSLAVNYIIYAAQ